MRIWFSSLVFFAAGSGLAPLAAQDLQVHPSRVTLDSAVDRHRFVVIETAADGTTVDVTADVTPKFDKPGVVRIESGALVPVANGEVRVTFERSGRSAQLSATVSAADVEPPMSYSNDVLPVLTRAGCNSGACHGAASGKNGFGLTLFAYDPGKDHLALTREFRGRRINRAEPDASLILLKPTGQAKHKGGSVLEHDSPHYQIVRDWIEQGAADDSAKAPKLIGLSVAPKELVLRSGQTSRIVVTAEYDDGSLRDVTDTALVSSSSDSTAQLDEAGVLTAKDRGEAYVLARFGFLAQVAQIIVVPEGEVSLSMPAPANAIDEFVFAKLQKLRLSPAPKCDDATFARRVFLDVIGRLPSREDLERFLADDAPNKRDALVDELLGRPEFSDLWAAQWAEVLRIEPRQLETKGATLYARWLKESFRDGVPFDQIVRDMLTAVGSNFDTPEANYYVVSRDPKVIAENCAQVFLGIRLQCAQCHNHPFERWTMDDYYGFTAFFGRVGRKRGEDPRETVIYPGGGEVRNARNNQVAPPTFLGGDSPKIPNGADRRSVLAAWLTSPENEWFTTNVGNRIWSRFFGRGIVEPVDDVRVSNPPSHPALHRWLGKRLADSQFDLRDLIRQICASHTYQAAEHPDAPPAATLAGREPRRMPAEQMLDSIAQVTGVPTKFRGLPLGASATQVPGADPGNRFLDLFGRPRRQSACACDRRGEPTLNQVLHLINGDTIEAKIRSGNGWLSKRLAETKDDAEILHDLFLRAYARAPDPAERDHLLRSVQEAKERTQAWQDLMWAVLNSKEFLFQH